MATGYRRQRGFTLIEIMVVVIVIGLAVSLVNLAVGNNDPQSRARKAVEDFLLRANYVAEESVLKGETHGLFVEIRPVEEFSTEATEQWCYQWRRVRDRQWNDVPELAENICLPEGLQMDIVVDDDPWEYDPELEFQNPVLGFFPSGDASAEVEIAIYSANNPLADEEDATQRIRVDVMGGVHWLNEEARLAAEKR